MNSVPKKLLLVILIIIGIAAVYFSFFKPLGEETAVNESGLDGTNAPIALPSVNDLEGNQVALDAEKLIFVNIWATWCGPCNMEMPGIQKLYDKYKDQKNIAFYIISDEDAETVTPFIARKGYNLPFYQFVGPYPPALDGNAIPRTYIIYKGKILAQEIGASKWDSPEIFELIDRQLADI